MNAWRSAWVVIALLLASAAWTAAGRLGELPQVAIDNVEVALADDATGTPDAGDWRALDLNELAVLTGPYWIRADVVLSSVPASHSALALRLSMRAASEVWWNGQLLGRNGRVGASAASEVPGRIDWTVPLPTDTGPGKHRLLILASSFHTGFVPHRAELGLQIGPLDLLYQRAHARWLVAAVAVGAVAVAGMYFVAMQGRRTRSTRSAERLLILLGLAGLLLPLAEGWRVLVGYSYDLHPLRLNLLLLLNACAATLLPAYLHARFGRVGSRWPLVGFAAALLLILLAVPSYDGRSLLLHLLGLLTSLAILLRARGNDPQQRRLPVIALLLATLLVLPSGAAEFLDGLYVISLAVLMTFLLLQHAASLAGLDREVAELQAQRARLSTQLMQRSIHPHWLMNTLTSLQELIEQAPAHASRMVELLADEFARMRAIGERASIPLREEIELCRVHLEIVGAAHGKQIAFDVEGDIDGIELPPGILHALVENALTHAGPAACAAADFQLRISRANSGVSLQLHAALGKAGDHAPVERTGSHFIRASLAAAYPSGASFEHGRDGRHWHSRIELPCAC